MSFEPLCYIILGIIILVINSHLMLESFKQHRPKRIRVIKGKKYIEYGDDDT